MYWRTYLTLYRLVTALLAKRACFAVWGTYEQPGG
jgi:hypothetical protein